MIQFILRLLLRIFFKAVLSLPWPVRFQRIWLHALTRATLKTSETTVESMVSPLHGQRVSATRCKTGNAILYLHGGAYVAGSAQTHVSITTRLAKMTGATVYALDYRLAPEHPYPAANEDAVAAYRALLKLHDASRIAIAGDSAGGGLSLKLAIALRAENIRRPSSVALISPWTDLSMSGESVITHAARDPMLARSWLERAAASYRAGLGASDPRVSPLFARLEGLPPMLIQVGSDEILLSDSERLARAASLAGIDVELDIAQGLWHVYQAHSCVLAAADEALERMGTFFKAHWPAESIGNS